MDGSKNGAAGNSGPGGVCGILCVPEPEAKGRDNGKNQENLGGSVRSGNIQGQNLMLSDDILRKKAGEGSYIDDITWNDLDMDTIFMLLNHTWSCIGESYLYFLLRRLSFSTEELEERERIVRYFAEHGSEREQMEYFAKSERRERVRFLIIFIISRTMRRTLRRFTIWGLERSCSRWQRWLPHRQLALSCWWLR